MNEFTRTNIKVFGGSEKEMACKSTNGYRCRMCFSCEDLFYIFTCGSVGWYL